tara:strand:+ start:4290 stop:4982 length:693 start_codon:yes stop_codon:yes gene_type:complete
MYANLHQAYSDPTEVRENFNYNPKKILYIHIPKTGGTSVEDSFLKAGISVGRFAQKPKKLENTSKVKCSYWHIPPKYLDLDFTNHITLTIIRKPFPRFFSEHNWQMRARRRKQVEDIDSWAIHIFNDSKKKYDFLDCHSLPQSEYLFDKNNKMVPNIIRLEYLEEDFAKFKKKYNLPNIQMLHSNRSDLKVVNGVRTMSKKTEAMVKDFYKKDFELFEKMGWYTKEELEL